MEVMYCPQHFFNNNSKSCNKFDSSTPPKFSPLPHFFNKEILLNKKKQKGEIQSNHQTISINSWTYVQLSLKIFSKTQINSESVKIKNKIKIVLTNLIHIYFSL